MKKSLRKTFNQLKSLDNPQQRGYELEKLIFKLLQAENLSPSPPYRQPGEQIDGLFKFDHRFYLLEMKWTSSPVSVSDLYIFRAKIESKFVGTASVFISMNGYTTDTSEVLRYGRELNVILFNGKDLELAVANNYSFATVLETKIRHASQRGEVYYPYEVHLKTQAREVI
jgi:hypothetical protein